MDKRRSVLNVCTAIIFKLLVLALSIVVRRELIFACGNQVNGVNALYLSVIGFLAVAELGVGSAITFCMYRPIVEGDENAVSALYQLFKKLYTIISVVILVVGLAITPFVRYFAKDYAELNINFQGTFVLMVISVVLTYAFSAKTSLINAHKNDYISTAITSGGLVLQNLLQIAVLRLTKSFSGYLMCRIAAVLVQWVATEIVTNKKYHYILSKRCNLEKRMADEVSKSIKAMFMHKIGTLLASTSSNVVISAFIGATALGLYTNYTTIVSAVSGVLTLVFTSLTSVVGHFWAKQDIDKTREYCEEFYALNFLLGIVFYLGYYAVVDSLVEIFFGKHLLAEGSIPFVITLNSFVQFMRRSVLLFRDAAGLFYNDRWKPLVEGVANLAISLMLVNRIGVAGVVIATIITNLLISHIVEPYVLYKNAFAESPRRYYATNYVMIAVFVVMMFCVKWLRVQNMNPWVSLIINGLIATGVSFAVGATYILTNRKLKNLVRAILSNIIKRAR